MLLSVSLAVSLAFALAHPHEQGEQCDAEVSVPPNFFMGQPETYPQKEAGLQIFTELTIPCNGKANHKKLNPQIDGFIC